MQKYWHAFNSIPELSATEFYRIQKLFPDLKTAWQNAHQISTLKKARIKAEKAELINQKIRLINPDRELEKLRRLNIKMLINQQPEYPYLLKQIYDPPPVLYYQGTLAPDEVTLAIVGCRKSTFYGEKVIEEFIPTLIFHKITVVSGLAYGIDSLAHRETLKNHGRTLAVLGCGLDRIYPSENTRLADQIKENGAVISEFPPGTEPLKFHFPLRNRIISGLSLGVLIVEAGQKSGALITAYQSIDQNREVFAVPGSVFHDQSKGTNSLIQKGHAHAILTAQDLLDKLNEIPLFKVPQAAATIKTTRSCRNKNRSQTGIYENPSLSPAETQILACLDTDPLPFDQIHQKTRLSLPQINSTLTLLELKGIIKSLPGNHYVRN